jgi:hypothetical protein
VRSLLVFERYFKLFQLRPLLLEIEFRLLDLLLFDFQFLLGLRRRGCVLLPYGRTDY